MQLGFAARLAISLVVLGAVLWFVDVRQVWRLTAGASPAWLAAAVVANCAALYLTARVLASLCGGRIAPAAILRVNLISVYFGTFLPGDVAAGLVSRIRYLGMSSWQEVVHRTIVERLVGLATYSALAAGVLLPSSFGAALGPLALALPLGVLAAATAGLVLVRKRHGFMQRLPWARKAFAKLAPEAHIPRFALGATAFAWSFAAYLVTALVPFALLRGLGLQVTYLDALVVGYLLTLAQLVPMFFAGIGIRDASAIALLHTIGIAAPAAVAFSTLVLAMIVVMAVLGGIAQVGMETRR